MESDKKPHIYICTLDRLDIYKIELDDWVIYDDSRQKRLVKDFNVENTTSSNYPEVLHAWDDVKVESLGVAYVLPIQRIIDVENVDYGLHTLRVYAVSRQLYDKTIIVSESSPCVYLVNVPQGYPNFKFFGLEIDLYTRRSSLKSDVPDREYPGLAVKLNSVTLDPDPHTHASIPTFVRSYHVRHLCAEYDHYDDSNNYYTIEISADGYIPHKELIKATEGSERPIHFFLSDLEEDNSWTAGEIIGGIITVITVIVGAVFFGGKKKLPNP